MAYESDESGRFEIYVQTFPDLARKERISIGGGTAPVWRGDGRELFFSSPDGRLMAARIASSGTQPDRDTPSVLFAMPAGPSFYGTAWPYAASRDGQRFLINTLVDGASPITILLNWKPRE